MDSFFSYYITYNAASKHYYYSRGIFLYSFTSSVPLDPIYRELHYQHNFQDNYGGNF